MADYSGSAITLVSLLIAAISLIASIYYAAFTKKTTEKQEIEKHSDDMNNILMRINGLATRDYLDQKLENELSSLKKDFNFKMEDLKSNMKAQIDELKHDIKSQKEFTSEIKIEMVKTRASVDSAHKRTDTLEKRIDDIVAMIKK